MFKIYGMHTPMFLKVVLAAEEMGVNYEVVDVDLMKAETRTPDHIQRHPFGKVPVIEHEGKFVFESNAIIRYIANFSNSKLYPINHFERAQVDQWVDYFTIQPGRWITNAWFETCIAPEYFDREADQKIVKEAQESLLEVMPKIDQHLENNKFLTGSNLSLADLNAYVTTMGFKDAQLNLGDFRNFIRWFEEMNSLESVKKIIK